MGDVKTRCISETLVVLLLMRKTLLIVAFLMYGIVSFAQDVKQPEVPVPAVPDKIMIQLLQAEVAALRTEVTHIHQEDIEQIFKWLQYFKAENDRMHSQSAEPLTRDRSGDRF